MDVIAIQLALNKVKKLIGRKEDLTTSNKSTIIEAINELDENIRNIHQGTIYEYTNIQSDVEENEERSFYLPFISKGMIKGVKCLGNYDTGDFYVTIYTKDPAEGGEYVYASGKVTTVLWDIMDIPFTDASGDSTVYVTIKNEGVKSDFKLIVYTVNNPSLK